MDNERATTWNITAQELPNRRINSKWPTDGWHHKRPNNSLMWPTIILSLFFPRINVYNVHKTCNFLLRYKALIYLLYVAEWRDSRSGPHCVFNHYSFPKAIAQILSWSTDKFSFSGFLWDILTVPWRGDQPYNKVKLQNLKKIHGEWKGMSVKLR